MASTVARSPLLDAIASQDPSQNAIIHLNSRRAFTYGGLHADIEAAEKQLREVLSKKSSTAGTRVAFIAENSYDYVVTLFAIISAEAVAVPLAPSFPATELQYIIENSGSEVLLVTHKYRGKADELLALENFEKKPLVQTIEKCLADGKREAGSGDAPTSGLKERDLFKAGMMLYTSGTTSRPKGVLLTESNLLAQAKSLSEAWKYHSGDHLLHVLPLHHIHGTVNGLITPLYSGCTIEMMFPFNAEAVWKRFAAPFEQTSETSFPKVTFFTAVPTIWSRLLNTFPSLPEATQKAAKEAIQPKNLRLNISGSAALPVPTKKAWTELSGGNVLLERYGMTEVGMALSCGLDPADRVDGSVGWALPSVEARLVETETGKVIAEGEEIDSAGKEREGEIQLRGPTVFQEYWRNEEATRKEFTSDEDGKGKWFKTGDVAVRRIVDGAGQSDQPWAKGPMYFIKGRNSVDIIKTGGEKVSALEIEREFLGLPEVSEVAIVGLPSEQWGQKVAAIVVLSEQGKTAGKGGKPWSVMDMRRQLKEKLVNYKIPQEMKVVESLPRNAMGKINKKDLVKVVFPDSVEK